ncbi:MAG: OmpA family protein, partial [Pseudomonadota bacterium]|nr:OmpA family protein [Pseudomonadota bacterium]
KKKLEKKTYENKSNNKLKKEDAEFVKSNSVLVKDNQFHIIYKPFQDSLSEEAIIKVIETSNKFNKEQIITIKSYASRNKSQGSSEARRLSLSRALEVRSIFIENNFPATNILIKALGTEKNKEGFTDIILIEVN